MLKTEKVFDPEKANFAERMKKLSDHDLIMVLRKRNDYHPRATKEAIDEAIKRGILKTEADLESKEFSPVPFKRFGWFVRTENKEQAQSILSSLTRILYIFSLVPLIYGGIDVAAGQYINAVVSAVLAIAMLYLTYRTAKKKQTSDAVVLIVVSTLAALFSTYHFWGELDVMGYMEILVIVVIPVLVLFISFNIWHIIKWMKS